MSMDKVYMVCQKGYEEDSYIPGHFFTSKSLAMQDAEQLNRKYNSGKYVNRNNIYQVIEFEVSSSLTIA